MKKIISMPAVIICLLLGSPINAEGSGYQLVDGKFYTDEGEVPAGCFGQLMTELNGDNVIAAVYLNRPELRGCITANFPYPTHEEDWVTQITYTVIETLPHDTFRIKVCQEWEQGTLRVTCDGLYVQFKNRSYRLESGQIKNVLSLEKTGEWRIY